MPKSSDLNKTFHIIMERMIATGKAPNYTEIAADLGVSPTEGQKALHKLFSTSGFPGWFYPNTDTIMSFAPFNNAPNNYRLTIDDEQKWFGQGAFESLAVCWLFPGKTVRIDSVCLDCGEAITLEVKDGKIESEYPKGLIGHVSVALGKWKSNVEYSGSTMNFFRSEEHLRNWEGFQEIKKEGIIALSDAMRLFSGPYFTKRREPDYFSDKIRYAADMVATMDTLENAGSYWRLKWFEKIVFSLVVKLKAK